MYDLLKQQNETYQDALDKMNDINKLLRFQKELENTKNIDLNVYKSLHRQGKRNTQSMDSFAYDSSAFAKTDRRLPAHSQLIQVPQ